jgi:hypothetical protein
MTLRTTPRSPGFPATTIGNSQCFALIIGNGAFENIDPFKNPPNDARLIWLGGILTSGEISCTERGAFNSNNVGMRLERVL